MNRVLDRGAIFAGWVGAGMAAVIYGHTHRPEISWRDGVLYLNPGSAGPRRFSLPVAVAIVEVTSAGLEPRIVPLDVKGL